MAKHGQIGEETFMHTDLLSYQNIAICIQKASSCAICPTRLCFKGKTMCCFSAGNARQSIFLLEINSNTVNDMKCMSAMESSNLFCRYRLCFIHIVVFMQPNSFA